MDYNHIILISYIVVWLFTLYVYLKRKRYFDVVAFVLLTYFVFAIMSYMTIDTIFYNFKEIRVLPFVYLYFAELLGLYPLMKIDLSGRVGITPPNMTFFKYVSLFIIFVTVIQLPSTISSFSKGINQMLLTSLGGAELYQEHTEAAKDAGGGISNIFAIFSLAFFYVAILFLFYSLTTKRISKYIKIGLFVSILLQMLAGISTGQRNNIVEPVMIMAASFFMFYRHFSEKLKKRVIYVCTIAVVLLSVPFVAITSSRFDSTGAQEAVVFYAGHENLIFNNYAFDNGGIRYGDRTFPLFKKMAGFSNVPDNYWDRRIKYSNLKVNDEVFCTYVGDFVFDFGPVVAFIIISLFSIIMTKRLRTKHGIVSFHQLVAAHFIIVTCTLGGFKLYPFADTPGNLKLIVYVLVYFVFLFTSNSKKNSYFHPTTYSLPADDNTDIV